MSCVVAELERVQTALSCHCFGRAQEVSIGCRHCSPGRSSANARTTSHCGRASSGRSREGSLIEPCRAEDFAAPLLFVNRPDLHPQNAVLLLPVGAAAMRRLPDVVL